MAWFASNQPLNLVISLWVWHNVYWIDIRIKGCGCGSANWDIIDWKSNNRLIKISWTKKAGVFAAFFYGRFEPNPLHKAITIRKHCYTARLLVCNPPLRKRAKLMYSTWKPALSLPAKVLKNRLPLKNAYTILQSLLALKSSELHLLLVIGRPLSPSFALSRPTSLLFDAFAHYSYLSPLSSALCRQTITSTPLTDQLIATPGKFFFSR